MVLLSVWAVGSNVSVESVGFNQAVLVGIIQISRPHSFLSLSIQNQQLVPDGPARSLLTATVGPRVLTRLDDGSGGTSPERVAALWAEAGIRNSQQILQVGPDPVLLDYTRIRIRGVPEHSIWFWFWLLADPIQTAQQITSEPQITHIPVNPGRVGTKGFSMIDLEKLHCVELMLIILDL